MNRLIQKVKHHKLRQARVRAKVTGTKLRPRLSVHISNHHVSAQLIDDQAGQTLAYISTIGQKTLSNNMTERSKWVGEEIAKKAATAKISDVVFDRGAKLYHGRVKTLAEAAREKGLRF
jgi:large subunit ribosomal protein L18